MVIAGSVEPRNRFTGVVDHARAGIGRDAGEGAEGAGTHVHGVERALLDRCQRGVGAHLRIPAVTVEWGGTAAELRVLAAPGVLVEFAHGLGQRYRIDPALFGELFDGVGLDEVTGLNVGQQRHRDRLGEAQRVFAHEGGVGDLPGFHRLAVLGGREQPVHVVVVPVGLIHEAASVLAHADGAGLGTVHNVREHTLLPVRVRDQGDRAPGRRGAHLGVEYTAGSQRHVHAVAFGFARGQRPVFGTGRRLREELTTTLHIVRETAGGQHHAAAGPDEAGPLGGAHHGTDHTGTVGHQLLHGSAHEQLHAQIIRRLHQASRQCSAVDQMQRAAAGDHVPGVRNDASGGVHPALRGELRGREHGGEVLAGHDAHAEERRRVVLAAHLLQQRLRVVLYVNRGRAHRAVASAGAGEVTVDVVNFRTGHELQVRAVVEEVNHVRDGFQEGIDLFTGSLCITVAEHAAQVGAELLRIFVHALGLGQRCAGGPGPAPGPGGGPAQRGGLIGDDDIEAVVGGSDGCGEAACATAGHQHVGVMVRESSDVLEGQGAVGLLSHGVS